MYVIAEAGVNHNGKEDLAIQLIDVAAKSGADAVKFQTFRAEKLVAKGTATADYQKQQTGSSDQYAMLKGLELDVSIYARLFDRCQSQGIDFLSTPFDLESAQLLVDLGMNKIKVPSGELTNIPFIKSLAEFDLPMILSTGMADILEVVEAVDAVAQARLAKNLTQPLSQILTVLHCTSNYPAANEDVNLKAITTLQDSLNLPIGYSDHTQGIVVSVAAAALGAVVLEKHFTLDRNMSGPDHQASIEAGELSELVSQARRVASCLGDGKKEPAASEHSIRELVRRSLVLKDDQLQGHMLVFDDVVLLRPGTGIAPKYLDRAIGRTLCQSKKAGDILQWEDFAK